MVAVPQLVRSGGVFLSSSFQATWQVWPPWQVVVAVGDVMKTVASVWGRTTSEPRVMNLIAEEENIFSITKKLGWLGKLSKG